MSDLVVIVPSRGRSKAARELVEAFEATCTADTELVFALDRDDPALPEYKGLLGLIGQNASMVQALNRTAIEVLERVRFAVGFMGDDHRPRTVGWDTRYLQALGSLPGLVYGNDLLQGVRLPTQVAMSASVVRALGHMAPPVLTHLYVDNYWRDLGQATGCLTYLPDVVVEHLHPIAGKAAWDEGYQRVNDRSMYDRDRAAYAAYWAEHADRDVMALRSALTGAAR